MKQVFGYTLLVGLIILFFWLSYFVSTNHGDTVGTMIPFGFGLFFLALLVYAVTYELRIVRKKRIVAEDYVEIMTTFDYVESLGDNLHYVHTKWQDPDGGAMFYFKSDYVEVNPKRFLEGKQIPVKISRNNYQLYVVDLSMLPRYA